MSSNDRKSTLALKYTVSVLSHAKHAHLPKRWKPGKNVRWQDRQLVVGQIKRPVSRRNRELGNQLQGILSKTNHKKLSHTITSTQIKVLTSSATYFGKRRAAPTLYPSTKDPAYQLVWGRSLCGRATHRRSRRWRCSCQRPLSTVWTCTWQRLAMTDCSSAEHWSVHTAAGCCTMWATCIDEKQRGRQPAVRYTEEEKKDTHTQTHEYASWYAWLHEEQKRIRVRPPTVKLYSEKQVNKHAYLCFSACICAWGARVNQHHTRHHRAKQKKEQITYTHTSMHAGVYDCMRSDSESELGNQLSGILRKANKQTCILVCRCMNICMKSDSESASHSSPPQLKGVRVISACARMLACWYYFANLCTVSVCLPVHTVTHEETNTQATLKTQANTCQAMIENQHLHSSTLSQYSATRNTRTHWSNESPEKMTVDRFDNWLLDKSSSLYRGEIRSLATRCKLYSAKQNKKEQTYTCTDTQVRMLICMNVWGARVNQSQATSCQVYSEKQANKHAYLCASVCMSEAQYLSTQPRETRTLTKAMKARPKCPVAGPTTGCWTNQATCIEGKTES
jgi:hypothetical protein